MEDEIDTLNRLVVIFLETAELRAKNRTETQMKFWQENITQIIRSNDFPLLDHTGSISHQQMDQQTSELYLDFDQRRKKQEAITADLVDDADLQALEQQLKHRPNA